ncbi:MULTISPECIES: STING domain-containing protein [unclassified Variovorax]|uniref:STING domain-containing protein n=1 Tax=unclassified Variovorax TaxID=663243 RepID=UPI001BD5F97D|nr:MULTISPECIES: STING domain-containing protein [unclassified Variovorax]
MDKRPTVFIGSSSEGLEVAKALEARFGDKAVVRMWNGAGQVFRRQESYLDSLLTASSLYEFAVLVFTSDDETTSRDVTRATARDNILFEYGLFLGRVGKHRAFALVLDKLPVPSDLQGIHFDRFKLGPDNKTPDEDFGALADRIVSDILEHHATTAEFSQLPSTALAIGYFENFISRVCDQLDNYQPLKFKGKAPDSDEVIERELKYKTFTLNIVIPDDLKFVEQTNLKGLLRGLSQVTVSSGTLRDFPLYIHVLPAEDSTHLELFDVPTTMKSARRAIQKIFPAAYVGQVGRQTAAEQREISNFERALRLLISEHVLWEPNIKYRYLSEFLPKNGNT